MDELPPDLYLIRLQGPWQVVDGAGTEPRTVRFPLDDATAAAIAGDDVTLVRNFQRPTNLDRDERVLLVLPAEAEPRAVRLGESPISDSRELGGYQLWDLTPHLAGSNRLVLEFGVGPWREVLREPVLLGIMPDFEGYWWESLSPRGGGPGDAVAGL